MWRHRGITAAAVLAMTATATAPARAQFTTAAEARPQPSPVTVSAPTVERVEAVVSGPGRMALPPAHHRPAPPASQTPPPPPTPAPAPGPPPAPTPVPGAGVIVPGPCPDEPPVDLAWHHGPHWHRGFGRPPVLLPVPYPTYYPAPYPQPVPVPYYQPVPVPVATPAGPLALPARPAPKPVKREPAVYAQRLLYGDRLFRAGNLSRAEERYEQAVAADPTKAEPRLRLAQVALSRGRYAEAAGFVREALTAEPGYLANAPDLRSLFAEPTDLPKLLAKLEAHLQADPNDRDAWLVLGAEKYLIGRTREAADIFLRLTDRRPDPVLNAFLDATRAEPPARD